VRRAWAFLSGVSLQAGSGLVGFCQPGGGSPENNYNRSTTSSFCVGEFLLAASQIVQVAEFQHPRPPKIATVVAAAGGSACGHLPAVPGYSCYPGFCASDHHAAPPPQCGPGLAGHRLNGSLASRLAQARCGVRCVLLGGRFD
jgi:hypothetical protein